MLAIDCRSRIPLRAGQVPFRTSGFGQKSSFRYLRRPAACVRIPDLRNEQPKRKAQTKVANKWQCRALAGDGRKLTESCKRHATSVACSAQAHLNRAAATMARPSNTISPSTTIMRLLWQVLCRRSQYVLKQQRKIGCQAPYVTALASLQAFAHPAV